MSQSINPHKQNTRVNVRQRQIDINKALSVVKSRDELKKFE